MNLKFVNNEPLNHGLFCKAYLTALPTNTGKLLVTKVFRRPKFEIYQFLVLVDYYRQQLSKCRYSIPYITYYQSEEAIYLLRPYLYSSLEQYQPDSHVDTMAYQMIRAVREIHCFNLVHGDIKLSNFVVTETGEVYLTDFAPYKPGQFEEKDQVFLSYFFNSVKDPNRVVDSQNRISVGNMMEQQGVLQFTLCVQETDVFELGLALLDLYNGKACLTRADLQNIRDQTQLTQVIWQYVETILNDNIKRMVVQMLQLDSNNRLRLQQINPNNIISSHLLQKMVNVRDIFNNSPDNNILVLWKAVAVILGRKTQSWCYQCYTKSHREAVIDRDFFVSHQSSGCDVAHEEVFPSKRSPPYKTVIIQDRDLNECLLIIMKHCVVWLMGERFQLCESRESAYKLIATCFSCISAEYEPMALKTILQLIEAPYCQSQLSMFCYVFGCITELPSQYFFSLFYVFCRYFLPARHWREEACELIAIMRESCDKIYRHTIVLEQRYSQSPQFNVLLFAKCFVNMSQLLFRFYSAQLGSLKQIYKETFYYAQNSVFEQLSAEKQQGDQVEAVMAVLTKRLLPLYGVADGVLLRVITQANNSGARLQTLFLRMHRHFTLDRLVGQVWESKLGNPQFVSRRDNVQAMFHASKFIAHNPKIGKLRLIQLLSQHIIDSMSTPPDETRELRCSALFFLAELISMKMAEGQGNDHIHCVHVNHIISTHLIRRFLIQLQERLRSVFSHQACQVSNNQLTFSVRWQGFGGLSNTQVDLQQRIVKFIQFIGQISETTGINISAKSGANGLVITYQPLLITREQMIDRRSLVIYFVNTALQFQVFNMQLGKFIANVEGFVGLSVEQCIAEIMHAYHRIQWPAGDDTGIRPLDQQFNQIYSCSQVDEVYMMKYIKNQLYGVQQASLQQLLSAYLFEDGGEANFDLGQLHELVSRDNSKIYTDIYNIVMCQVRYRARANSRQLQSSMRNSQLQQFIDDHNIKITSYAQLRNKVHQVSDGQIDINYFNDLVSMDSTAMEQIMLMVQNVVNIQHILSQVKVRENTQKYSQQKRLLLNKQNLYSLIKQCTMSDLGCQFVARPFQEQSQWIINNQVGQLRLVDVNPDSSVRIRSVFFHKTNYIFVVDGNNSILIYYLPNDHSKQLKKYLKQQSIKVQDTSRDFYYSYDQIKHFNEYQFQGERFTAPVVFKQEEFEESAVKAILQNKVGHKLFEFNVGFEVNQLSINSSDVLRIVCNNRLLLQYHVDFQQLFNNFHKFNQFCFLINKYYRICVKFDSQQFDQITDQTLPRYTSGNTYQHAIDYISDQLSQNNVNKVNVPLQANMGSLLDTTYNVLAQLRQRLPDVQFNYNIIRYIGGFEMPGLIGFFQRDSFIVAIQQRCVKVINKYGIEVYAKQFRETIINYQLYDVCLYLIFDGCVRVFNMQDFKEDTGLRINMRCVDRIVLYRSEYLISRYNLLNNQTLNTTAQIQIMLNEKSKTMFLCEGHAILQINLNVHVQSAESVYITVVLPVSQQLLILGTSNGLVIAVLIGTDHQLKIQAMPLRAMKVNLLKALQQQFDSCFQPGSGLDGVQYILSEVKGNLVNIKLQINRKQRHKNGNLVVDEYGFTVGQYHDSAIIYLGIINDQLISVDVNGKLIQWI